MVLANAIGPTIMPFLAPLTMGLLVLGPLTILVATLEWRFFRRAGIQRGAFYHAVIANILSSLAGIAIVFACGDVAIALFLSLMGSVPVSVLFEGAYLHAIFASDRGPDTSAAGKTGGGKRFYWSWVIAGNLFSAFVLVLVALSADLTREGLTWSQRHWWRSFEPYINTINSMLCLSLLAWLIVWPLIRAQRSAGTNATVPVPNDRDIDRAARPLSSLRD